jgi:hypothetical protein
MAHADHRGVAVLPTLATRPERNSVIADFNIQRKMQLCQKELVEAVKEDVCQWSVNTKLHILCAHAHMPSIFSLLVALYFLKSEPQLFFFFPSSHQFTKFCN